MRFPIESDVKPKGKYAKKSMLRGRRCTRVIVKYNIIVYFEVV